MAELAARHWGGLLALILIIGSLILDRADRLEKPDDP